MASPTHSPTMESTTAEGNIRKRVCKACDRCRLKKSKCDGANPCSRCKADNAICVFGERKKTHDKVYPKGYVEMLEQQQTQLVAGLRELYRRLQTGEGWPGAPLHEGPAGHPLTHDVLERLDLLHIPSENGSPIQSEANFEEDFTRIQHRLLEKGAGYHVRRGSVSSDSDHGHASPSSNVVSPKHQMKFNDPFSIHRAPPTPPNNSPPFPLLSQLSSAKVQSIQQQQQQQQQIHQNAYTTNTSTVRTGLDPSYLMRPSWSTEGTPAMMTDPASMEYVTQFDSAMTYDEPMNNFDQFMMPAASALVMPDWNDPGEIDFNTYIDPIST